MADYSQGVFGTSQAGVEAINDVTVLIRVWFANRNPLLTRLPQRGLDRPDFQTYTHAYRTTSTTLGATITTNSVTVLTLADASFLMNHDILEVVDSSSGNVEFVQVNGDPVSSTVVNVTRGVGGTSALSTGTNGSTVYVVGNSRNGAEILQTGLSTIGVAHTQYAQTFQFPVAVGGSAQTTRAQVFPNGVMSPLDFNRQMQLQNMCDSIETSFYYGKAEAPTGSATAKMNGLRSMITTNNITAPTNAAAYTSTDLIRDVLQGPRAAGGEPDLLVVSTDWMSGFATWGHALERLSAGETIMGTDINVFYAPFLGGVTILEAPLLRPKTAIALTSSEVYVRVKRAPFWQERGRLGDQVQGDWLAELAIECQNENHHAFLTGVTAFSAN
jgi:hypothetical protein